MNTISKMCEGPSLGAKTTTIHMANPSHPLFHPSLGSTGPLGSAPPAGGVSKHPRVPVDLELGGIWVGDVQHSSSLRLSQVCPSLCPSSIGSWKFGCGSRLPPTSSSNPTRCCPVTPTTTTLSVLPSKPSSIIPNIPTPSAPPIPSTHTSVIRTATGGIKVVAKKPKKIPSLASNFVCDGIGCTFSTNSPYVFVEHQSMPHTWKPGSQNWCFKKANALAHYNKPQGIKAFYPTVFSSTDIRVKKGELSPNIIKITQEESTLPASSPSTVSPTTLTNSANTNHTIKFLTPKTQTLNPKTPILQSADLKHPTFLNYRPPDFSMAKFCGDTHWRNHTSYCLR